MTLSRAAVLLGLLCAWPLARASDAPALHLLIITGIAGEPDYRERFERLGESLRTVGRERLGVEPDRVVWLAENAETEAGRFDGSSRAESILDRLATLVARTRAGDTLLIVYIGHATARGDRVLFNLPGPDLSAARLASALDELPGRRVVVVHTGASSGAFVSALSAPGRAVVTATAGAGEDQHPRFAGHFIAALGDPAADADKDRQVSLLEAFRYTARLVEREYEAAGTIRTEHALLEDDADGVGSRDPGGDGDDGELARRIVLVDTTRTPVGSPEVARLEREARGALDRIEALARDRGGLERAQYESRLEAILVELALNRRALRALSR